MTHNGKTLGDLIWIGQRPNSKFAFGGGNGVQPFALLFEPNKTPKSGPAK